MSETDVEAFYAEQDRLMDLSDDDPNEFLARTISRPTPRAVGSSWKSLPTFDSRLHNKAPPGPAPLQKYIALSAAPRPHMNSSPVVQASVVTGAKLTTSQVMPQAAEQTSPSTKSPANSQNEFADKPSSPGSTAITANRVLPASPIEIPDSPISSFASTPIRSMKRKFPAAEFHSPREKPGPSPMDSSDPIEDMTTSHTPMLRQSPRIKSKVKVSAASPRSRMVKTLDTAPVAPHHASPSMVPPSPIEEFPSTFAAGLKRKDAPSLGDLVAQRIADHKAELKAEHRAAKRPRHKLVQLAAPPPPPTKLDAADQSSIIYIGSSSPAPAPASKPKAKPVVSKKPEAVKKPVKKAAKPESMSVPDFVQKLMDDRAANPPKKQIYVQTFRNMTIFFWDADGKKASPSTMNKMTKLAQHGATIQPVYDPATVTHIIIGTMAQGTNCKLSFFVKKALNGAAIPEHVPTLRWSWAAGIGQRCRDPDGLIPRVILEEFWQHAFFLERRNVGVDTTRVAQRKASMRARQEANRREVQDSEDEDDRYRPMSPEQSQFSGGPKAEEASSSKEKLDGVIDDPNDPLAPFYIDAIRDLDDRPENRWEKSAESDIESDDEVKVTVPKGRKGYQVDQVPGIPVASPNQDIIDKLRELQAIYEVKPGQEDKWKAWSYKKSIPKIAAYPTRLKSVAEARTIPGVGKKTADKIKEILETGGLRRTHYELADGTVTAMRLFQGIYGVGPQVAQKWVSNGLRTLEDLRNGEKGVKLTAAQKVGLKHYDDINDRMPREEAQALFELIKPIALKIDSKIYIEIMGSYRRGKADCGDIDIMITRDPSDGKTHAGLISQLLKKLKSAGIITDDLALPDKPHDPEAIYRGLCCLPQKGAKRRRIDFLCIPWESRGGALIYYTGDDIFNRSMRLKARRMGYSLNQRGLYEGVVRDPRRYGAKLNMGTLKASATEEEIFNILDIPFVPPVDRVRHREELLRRAGIKV